MEWRSLGLRLMDVLCCRCVWQYLSCRLSPTLNARLACAPEIRSYSVE